MHKIIQHLKTKWNISNNLDFILIMLVFSFAGMGVAISRKYIFSVLGLSLSPLWVKIVVSFLLIVPLYQLSTLIFALPLGQFHFFWERQKEIGRFISKAMKKGF